MSKKLVLIGLVQAKKDQIEAFNEWYLGNHIEDTFNCPEISSVRCLKAAKGFMGEPPAQFLTLYEFKGDNAEVAEQALGAYQMDPNGWAQRQPNNDSMEVVGAGWYHEEVTFNEDDL
ncbi:MAG: hypothetical protein ACI9UU_000395 [Candidatus Azotimanducaceae bacterium]|jgi:hypothetical protein